MNKRTLAAIGKAMAELDASSNYVEAPTMLRAMASRLPSLSAWASPPRPPPPPPRPRSPGTRAKARWKKLRRSGGGR